MRQENRNKWIRALTFAAFASLSNAEIVKDAYWEENHDFTDATVGVEVVDGVVQGTSAALTQRI